MIDSFRGNYGFLSNFHPCRVEIGRVIYPSAEHAYQAQKTLDLAKRKVIAKLETPGEAKRYGQKLGLRQHWETIKEEIMEEVVFAKFLQNQDLAELLLGTGDEFLVEGNTWGDRFWGVCRGEGRNMLGHILMAVRHELRAAQ